MKAKQFKGYCPGRQRMDISMRGCILRYQIVKAGPRKAVCVF
jgi:hypothetical protein